MSGNIRLATILVLIRFLSNLEIARPPDQVANAAAIAIPLGLTVAHESMTIGVKPNATPAVSALDPLIRESESNPRAKSKAQTNAPIRREAYRAVSPLLRKKGSENNKCEKGGYVAADDVVRTCSFVFGKARQLAV